MMAADPFKVETPKANFDLPTVMRWVARQHGKSTTRQFAEMAALVLPPHRISPLEYYQFALFRREFSPADRRNFLSQIGGAKLNSRLSAGQSQQNALLRNKVLTSHVLESAGFPIVPIVAFYSATGGMPGRRALGNAEDIAAFLRTEAVLPLFGKPLDSSTSVGAMSFVGREPDGAIRLGNGQIFTAEVLGAAICRTYPNGFIFQPLIRQHPDAAAVTGPAIGVLRVVTLWEEGGPQLLYTVQKLPSPGFMVDTDDYSLASAFSAVDPVSGAITRTQSKMNLNTKALETSPVTGAPLVGHVLPDVAASVALACEAHRLFPGHGILGFDVPATVDGPVILEINTSPYHVVYQRAFDRGLMAGAMGDRIRAAQAAMTLRDPKRKK